MTSDPREQALWVLSGPKSGDRTQMLALADLLARRHGFPVVEKTLAFHRWELLLHLWPRPTVAGLSNTPAAQLNPPWPRLVLTAGRRNELVALWIKRRSPDTRVVHLGRPWTHPRRFDAVISTAQYSLEAGGNVTVNPLPLHGVETDRLARAAEDLAPRLAELPRPWTVVLIGGDSGPFVFTDAQAMRLAERVNRLARGGSILLSTSARTPPAFAAALESALHGPRFVFRWGSGDPNPYAGYLALGDRFVVTAESMSMVTEALDTGRPVYLFAIEALGDRPWWLRPENYRWKPLSHRVAMALAPKRMRRDVTRVMGQLVESGRACWLDESPGPFQPTPVAANEDLERAARCVEDLLGLS
ncbi:MAG: ELM1/GtrOC1 family putative glycosyltransferase [Gammaproteobacteria bacterium]|jgi:mitochondrial fission protein ELM1